MTTNERLSFVLFEEEEKEEKESGKLNATSFFFISFVFVFVFFIKLSEGKRGIGIIDSSAPIRRRGRNGDDDDDSRGGNEDEDEEEETKRPRENNDEKEEQRDKVVTEEALILVIISLSLYNNRSLLVASMNFRPERFLAVFCLGSSTLISVHFVLSFLFLSSWRISFFCVSRQILYKVVRLQQSRAGESFQRETDTHTHTHTERERECVCVCVCL